MKTINASKRLFAQEDDYEMDTDEFLDKWEKIFKSCRTIEDCIIAFCDVYGKRNGIDDVWYDEDMMLDFLHTFSEFKYIYDKLGLRYDDHELDMDQIEKDVIEVATSFVWAFLRGGLTESLGKKWISIISKKPLL